MISIRLFGKFGEIVASGDQLSISADGIASVEDIYRYFAREIPQLHNQVSEPQVMVAVNQNIVARTTRVNDGDEVAFLPPVTGG